MGTRIKNKRVAILVDRGFEQIELIRTKEELEHAGAETFVVSPQSDKVRAWSLSHWGDEFPVDVPLRDADPDDYDGLVLPGGIMSADHLRQNERALEFIRAFFEAGKQVAAICRGTWPLIDAGVVEGRRLTSFPSMQSDLRNAGADWVDMQVVVDDGLITSRRSDDLTAFCEKLIEGLCEDTPHQQRN